MNSIKKKKEKETLGQDLKIIKVLGENFNPELYIDNKEEHDESD